MRGTTETVPASSAVVTIPNALSLARIALIPLFCWLIADEGTRLGLHGTPAFFVNGRSMAGAPPELLDYVIGRTLEKRAAAR